MEKPHLSDSKVDSLPSASRSHNIDNMLGSPSSIKEMKDEFEPIEVEESPIALGSQPNGETPLTEGFLSVSDPESKTEDFKEVAQNMPDGLQDDKEESNSDDVTNPFLAQPAVNIQ